VPGPTLVIPAAGRGSRLGNACQDRPKCLLQIGGRPILRYAIDAGMQAPVERIVIVIGRNGAAIVEASGERYAGVPVCYVVQPSPSGLADAVVLAASRVADAVLVINGDEVYDESRHDAAWRRFVAHGADGVVGYVRTEDRTRIKIGYGIELADNGRVIRLEEKPTRTWNELLGVGSWILRRSWFDYYRSPPINEARGERDFVAVIQAMLDHGCAVHGVELGGRFFNVNTEADLEQARRAMRKAPADRLEAIVAAK